VSSEINKNGNDLLFHANFSASPFHVGVVSENKLVCSLKRTEQSKSCKIDCKKEIFISFYPVEVRYLLFLQCIIVST
jgi:hypothetical protein